jgi:amino acid transporter
MAAKNVFEKDSAYPIDGSDPVVSSVSESVDMEDMHAGSQHLHQNLRGKEVQLFAIGGAIGTG